MFFFSLNGQLVSIMGRFPLHLINKQNMLNFRSEEKGWYYLNMLQAISYTICKRIWHLVTSCTLAIFMVGFRRSGIPSSNFLFSLDSCCSFLISLKVFVPSATADRAINLSSSDFFSRKVNELALTAVRLLARDNLPSTNFFIISSTFSKHPWLSDATKV